MRSPGVRTPGRSRRVDFDSARGPRPRFALESAAAAGATAWYCVFHVEYHTDRPHVFTWIQGYYRKEVIEPVGRAKTALLAKLAEKKDEP